MTRPTLPWLRPGWHLAPFFLVALGFGLLTIWFQMHQAMDGRAVQQENLAARVAGAGQALWFYLGKTLLPFDLNLIYPRVTIEPLTAAGYLPAAAWLAILLTAWCWRANWGRGVFVVLAAFTALLLPMLGLLDMAFLTNSRVSDHFNYASLIPILALVAAALTRIGRSANSLVREFPGGDASGQSCRRTQPRRQLVIGAALALVLVLGGLTFQRARLFATDEGLWRSVLAKNPSSWTAHNNLACILAEQNQLDAAMVHFEASLKLNPDNTKARCNLARALAIQGRPAEAEAQFVAALRMRPDDPDVHAQHAGLLADLGRRNEAMDHLRWSLRRRSDVATRLQLATLLHEAGRSAEAAGEFRAVLAQQPDTLEALSNLAWLLATAREATVRNGSDAVRFAERACALTQFTNARTVGILAAAHAEAGQFSNAVQFAQQAIQLANAGGNRQFATMNEQLLRLYRSGRPYHER